MLIFGVSQHSSCCILDRLKPRDKGLRKSQVDWITVIKTWCNRGMNYFFQIMKLKKKCQFEDNSELIKPILNYCRNVLIKAEIRFKDYTYIFSPGFYRLDHPRWTWGGYWIWRGQKQSPHLSSLSWRKLFAIQTLTSSGHSRRIWRDLLDLSGRYSYESSDRRY